MKMTNKKIALILVSVVILSSVVSYLTKAATVAYSSGYMILLDRNADETYLTLNNYSTIIYLPSSNCEGFVNYCSYDWPESQYPELGLSTMDVTKDGRIDAADFVLYKDAYGCGSGQACWNEGFNLQECYFTYNGGYFQDPSRDCYINESDTTLISKWYGRPKPSDPPADVTEWDNTDVNKDGSINLKDAVFVGMKYKTYADTFKDYACIKKKSLDISGPTRGVPNGAIDLYDIMPLAINYGKRAALQSCKSSSLSNLGNGRYGINVNGYGMYSVGASFRCYPV